jgi:pantetheine-phosphate adenylyltransferase
MLNKVVANILATKTHQSETAVQGIFNKFDFGCLDDANFHDLKFMYEKENQIFKEYQFTDLNKYIEGRVSFLSSKEFKNPHIKEILNYVKNRTYNIAIYPGSFNPFHIGHYNVLEKAEQLFDKVIVVMGVNADKKSSLDDLSFKKLKEQLPDRQVERHEGNIIKKFFIGNERNPVLIRGLRNGFDLMYEENYLTWCKEFHPILRYSMILCDKDYSHVSSSSIRSIDEKWILEKYIIPPYVV